MWPPYDRRRRWALPTRADGLSPMSRSLRVFLLLCALTLSVALSLVPYSAAYAADAGVEALQQWRRGSHLGALLFLPNMTRAFFVVVRWHDDERDSRSSIWDLIL